MIEWSLSLGHAPLWAHRLPPADLTALYAIGEVRKRRKARASRARIEAGARK